MVKNRYDSPFLKIVMFDNFANIICNSPGNTILDEGTTGSDTVPEKDIDSQSKKGKLNKLLP